MRRELIQREPSPPWDLVNQIEGNPYGLDYLLVLDFEATCEEVNPPDYIHEIIEFPVLLLNLKTLKIVRISVHGRWGGMGGSGRGRERERERERPRLRLTTGTQ